MAKSLRSKWKRKMRKVKRVRYAKRELDSLKRVAEQAKVNAANGDNELYTVITKDERDKQRVEKEALEKLDEEANNTMETSQTKKFDKKTMHDENGQYPVWMNQRAIQKLRGKKKNPKPKRGKKKLKFTPAW